MSAGRTAAALLALLLCTAGVAACEAPRQQAKCGWMSQRQDGAGRTAVLLDTTNSTRAGGPAAQSPDYADALRPMADDAVHRRDTISIAPFSGTTADLAWTAKDRSTDWQEGVKNTVNQQSREKEAGGCIGADLATAAASPPLAKGSDIAKAISLAAGWLRDGKGAKHLVVATDGLANTGCANLVHANFANAQEIDAIARECAGGDLKPGTLDGVTVEFVGIGKPAAQQPVPTTEQVAWLSQLWQKVCTGAGGRCTVSTTSVTSAGTGDGTPPSKSVEDPSVPFDPSRSVYSISAAQFDTDQTTLRASAMDLILQISVEIRDRPNLKVEVFGYADPRGSAGHNQDLSQRRAEAVAAALQRNKVPGVTPRGLGVTQSCPFPIEVPAGAGDDEKLQCFRRVDIVAT
ncbi:OmpA family protein [Dactylosporangium salmoneum]|uniref:OmpA-like domain-containing protein n=1 Tax=Dactylosporangium salmoneum TaxID=53361 RepID=A0ABN3GVK9_9ACTN